MATRDGSDFISQYLSYVGETEAPIFYHRWCCISIIGTILARQYKFKFGHSDINPNQYIMLIGNPGARKSTAIKLAKDVLKSTGYDTISADKSSKEKFLEDLEASCGGGGVEGILNQNLWGDMEDINPAEMYIACDEFNDFIGHGNFEFISLLGSLWDFRGMYKNRIKSGRSVTIPDPTINILGGNTHVNFARAFPPDILGQGFFSRLLLINGEPTGKKITYPKTPSTQDTLAITSLLNEIKLTAMGEADITPTAYNLLDKIYQSWKGLDDIRFEHYSNRRFNHLIKLCLICSASSFSSCITDEHVVRANTILTHTEHLMPKALGEFGKSKNSDISHKIMQVIGNADHIVSIKELWESLHADMEKINDLSEMLRNLSAANKIQTIQGGFLPMKKVIEEVRSDVLDYSYLTTEEREMSK